MSTRPFLSGVATVEVDMYRYDELLRKEELVNVITRLLETDWVQKNHILAVIQGEDAENE